MDLGVGLLVIQDRSSGQWRGCRRAEPAGAGADLEARVGSVEGLALLAAQELGERLGRSLDRVRGTKQELDSLLVGALPRRAEPRARHGVVEVVDGADRGPTRSPVAGSRMSRPAGSVIVESRMS